MKNNNSIAEIKAENKQLKSKISELEALVTYYEEQFRLSKQKQFGSSSEKTENPDQISFVQAGLFDEVENTAIKIKTSQLLKKFLTREKNMSENEKKTYQDCLSKP